MCLFSLGKNLLSKTASRLVSFHCCQCRKQKLQPYASRRYVSTQDSKPTNEDSARADKAFMYFYQPVSTSEMSDPNIYLQDK